MIDYLSTGKAISEYIGFASDRVSVKYNHRAVQALAKNNEQLSQIIEDVFIDSRNPQLEFLAERKAKRNILTMVTKDGSEVLTNRLFLMPFEQDIRAFTPEADGRVIKIKLDKDAIAKIKAEDNAFSKYITELLKPEEHPYFTKEELENFIKKFPYNAEENSQYYKEAENPILEISFKKGDKYSVSTFILRDGNNVIAKGAYSDSTDKNGKKIRKYHFTNGNLLSRGYAGYNKRRSYTQEVLPKNLIDKYMMNNGIIFSERTNRFLREKFGLCGNNKLLSYEQIAQKWWLTKERVKQIIYKATGRLESLTFTPEQLKLYEENKNTPKFLNKEETAEFIHARNMMMSDIESEIKEGISRLKNWNAINESRKSKLINNIINDIKENVIPKDRDTFISHPDVIETTKKI